MKQKEQIIKALENSPMTQGELSTALYGDNKHITNVYVSLMHLVNNKFVIRKESYPAIYLLSNKKYNNSKITISSKVKKNTNFNHLITNELLEETYRSVKDSSYGRENELITNCFKMFPKNDNLVVVAMKIGLIDITNSTHISQHKSRISVVELAEVIVNIDNIDERIKNGDPEVVNEIARCNGKINLFSFASKYCCYHNTNLYGKDDYSILDTILKQYLPKYFNDITTSQIQKWQDNFKYKEYNDYITKKLNELNINVEYKKRKFDHFVWFTNRKQEK